MYEIRKISKAEILDALQEVKDPEIPTISLVELGIVSDIKVLDEFTVAITLTPTFSGCPALKVMENMVREKVEMLGVRNVEVKTNFDVQWNTDMITAAGLEALKKHGLAPPPKLNNNLVQIELLKNVECPHCGSKDTTLRSPFGPTLCRSIHYCNSCLNAFEQFKPVS
jgi:ring-1,2-phenylacetyl-CoA epoxidase subunit PaaD